MVVTNLATNPEKKPETKAQCWAQGLLGGNWTENTLASPSIGFVSGSSGCSQQSRSWEVVIIFCGHQMFFTDVRVYTLCLCLETLVCVIA